MINTRNLSLPIETDNYIFCEDGFTFQKINKKKNAQMLWEHGNAEMFMVDDNYVEALIETDEAFEEAMSGSYIVATEYVHATHPVMALAILLTENIHGSGINADWEITENSTSVRCNNAYQIMNENGSYVGWARFTLVLNKKDPEKDRIMIHREDWHRASYYQVKEYLEDTIFTFINEKYV